MSRAGWVLIALTACTPALNVGSDTGTTDSVCALVEPPAAACPAEPWGAKSSFATADDLQQKLVGRWAFCGGELRYSGRGPMAGLPFGSGIEFWADSGGVHYAYLTGTPPAVSRSKMPGASGDVQLSVGQGQGRASLVAEDGLTAAWTVDYFAGQQVLQNNAFDVWNFVPMP